MSRFTTSIILYSLIIIGIAVGLSYLIILQPIKQDLAEVSTDQQELKEELTTDLSEIKQTLEATNSKLESKAKLSQGSVPAEDDAALLDANSTIESLAAKRLENINNAIDQTLTDLDTPDTKAIGGLQTKVTIDSYKFNSVEIYEQPDPSSLPIGSIRYGTNYPVIDQTTDWYQVTIPGGTKGWVMATYVKEVQ